MPKNLNASHIFAQLAPAEAAALLTFFYDSWESASQVLDLGDECARLDIDRDALASAASLIGNHWNGHG